MKFNLHLIGAVLLLAGTLSATTPAKGQVTVEELRSKLGDVRRDRQQIDAEWEATVRKLAAQLATPPPLVRSIAYSRTVAPPRRPFGAVGVWSADAEARRQERRDWIDAELRRRRASD